MDFFFWKDSEQCAEYILENGCKLDKQPGKKLGESKEFYFQNAECNAHLL